MKLLYSLAIPFLLLGFIESEIQKKVIRDKEFDIHFFVSLKDKDPHKERTYYWFKSGEIHKSFGASGGDLLHSDYSKYYKDNALAEKGVFKYGLKEGIWKEWNPDGGLKLTQNWNNGVKDGKYKGYDDSGNLKVFGKYRKGKKDGVWVNLETKDTTWYKKGVAYKEPPKIAKKRMDSIAGKEPFLKRALKPFKKIFKKKDKKPKGE